MRNTNPNIRIEINETTSTGGFHLYLNDQHISYTKTVESAIRRFKQLLFSHLNKDGEEYK